MRGSPRRGKRPESIFAFDRIGRSPNTLDAHRLIRWAWSAGRQDAVVERLFHAFFVEGRISAIAPFWATGASVGRHGRRHRACGCSTRRRTPIVVRGDIEQARSLGVTGVPFFILDGQDRPLGRAAARHRWCQAIAKALEPADET